MFRRSSSRTAGQRGGGGGCSKPHRLRRVAVVTGVTRPSLDLVTPDLSLSRANRQPAGRMEWRLATSGTVEPGPFAEITEEPWPCEEGSLYYRLRHASHSNKSLAAAAVGGGCAPETDAHAAVNPKRETSNAKKKHPAPRTARLRRRSGRVPLLSVATSSESTSPRTRLASRGGRALHAPPLLAHCTVPGMTGLLDRRRCPREVADGRDERQPIYGGVRSKRELAS
ncbi:hypothetical protein SKAU_G00040210 [Synaphobranchus kaupii]|uniref:Uncharacterized protein n=1 Tax=Synaphobranchus kaupii TaxID=118154 RepID=A0A9Q1J7N4_SYNKA|nr:hypothetical protein SKAU_G00040210 [Synaphobranchus kaupii]